MAMVPVTILTGFLGSGKTTLLNHILTASHGKKIAVIENEFGEVGIDDALLQSNMKAKSEEAVIEMMNGCICCTVRQDLVVVLKKLATRMKEGTLKLDAIVIETTGMADPAPVAQTFFVDEDVKASFKLDGIVTMIDANHIEQHLDKEVAEGAENEAVEQVAFADRLVLNKIDVVSAEADLKRIEDRLKTINKFAPIVRTERSKLDVDAVLNLHAFDLKRTLEMDPEFLDTEGEHVHDESVTSVGINVEDELDLGSIQSWIGGLLKNKGTDLYRMKGVLNIQHSEQRFVYQAVHMLFDGNFMEPWAKDEQRRSKLTFIGKNLNEKELREGFERCIASEEQAAKRLKQLRFKVGDKVACNTGRREWSKGVVVALMYRDDQMSPGEVAPYQVQLDNGDLIYAPADEPYLIRRA